MRIFLAIALWSVGGPCFSQWQFSTTIDYGRSDENNVGSYARLAWDFNTSYKYPPFEHAYVNAVVAFDSIHDLHTDVGYANSSFNWMTVDTIGFWLGHKNISGENDTVVVSVIALSAMGHPTDTVLWADSIITNTSLTGPSWLNFGEFEMIPANLTVTPPDRVGVRLEYFGPFEDTAGFLGGYPDTRDSCHPFGGPAFSSFHPNSFYQVTGDSTSPTGYIPFIDCNGNGQQDPDETWYIQNVGIWIDVTIFPKESQVKQQPTMTWSISPNPANELITLQLDGIQVTQFQIHNALGQTVLTDRFSRSTKQLDISHLPAGWYCGSVRTSDGVQSQLLMIQ